MKTTTVSLEEDVVKECRRRGINISQVCRDALLIASRLPKALAVVSIDEAQMIIHAAEAAASLKIAKAEQDAVALEERKKLCMEVYSKSLAAQGELDAKQAVYKDSYSTYEEMAPLRSEIQSLQSVIDVNLAMAGFSNMNDMRVWMQEQGLIQT